MRKYMDGGVGCILYVLISGGRGMLIWNSFIKSCLTIRAEFPDLSAAHVFNQAMAEIKKLYQSANATADDIIMFHSLELLEDHFPDMWECVHGQ
jgi:hypothetical protein